MITIDFTNIAANAGFTPDPSSGRLNLPANQDAADKLGKSANDLLPTWNPGDDPIDVILTGAGPVWGHLCIAHALHGRVRKLMYSAPNAPLITIFNHGG